MIMSYCLEQQTAGIGAGSICALYFEMEKNVGCKFSLETNAPTMIVRLGCFRILEVAGSCR